MLATLIDKPFDSEDWIYEIKWDGYRSIAFIEDGKVNLRSRSDIPFNKNYPPVVEALTVWNVNAVVDGEVVVLNEEGKTEFNLLQTGHAVGRELYSTTCLTSCGLMARI